MQTIVTHTKPDMDAVTSCWLLQRFGGLADAQVVFVNTGSPDPDALATAAAVVDTGRVYDPATLRFDHHQDPRLPCAASLVFFHLGASPLLARLLGLINAGDWARPEAAESRELGLHAIFSGGLVDRATDEERLAWGYQLLDAIYMTEVRRQAGREALEHSVVYRSADGALVALRNAPQAASGAAFDAGATVVIFADYERNAIGITRNSEASVNVGDLVDAVQVECNAFARLEEGAELDRWYRHPAGFFAGRGTGKAPSAESILVDVAEIARLLDAAWVRD